MSCIVLYCMASVEARAFSDHAASDRICQVANLAVTDVSPACLGTSLLL